MRHHNDIHKVGRTVPWKIKPGKDWSQAFERRWAAQLGKRKPELLTKARAQGLSREVVDLFFEQYQAILTENGLEDAPERIFNLDETGLNTDPRSDKVFVQKQDRNAYLRSATCGKTMYSVLFCTNAKGEFLPPFTIYKGLHLYQSWTSGGPSGAHYGVTKSGWMENVVFESWFEKVFVEHVKEMEKPVLLMFDGHGSHLTYNTVKTAMDNSVIILCLPPNTSHAFQPLDVGVFKPVKTTWKDILKSWSRESQRKTVDKAVFPHLLRKLWMSLRPEHVIGGFRGSGLYPVDPERLDSRIVSSATDSGTGNQSSPGKKIADAVIRIISPQASPLTVEALANSSRGRKRVQAKSGEVLTHPEAVERLRKEHEDRCSKRKATEGITAKRRRVQATGEALMHGVLGPLENEVAIRNKRAAPRRENQDFDDQQPCTSRSLFDTENWRLFEELSDCDTDACELDEMSDNESIKVGEWVLVQCGAKEEQSEENTKKNQDESMKTPTRPTEQKKKQAQQKKLAVPPKKYVATVTSSSDGDYEVSYLRLCTEGSKTYAFPDPREIAPVEKADILKVLSQPSIDRRGRYFFREM